MPIRKGKLQRPCSRCDKYFPAERCGIGVKSNRGEIMLLNGLRIK